MTTWEEVRIEIVSGLFNGGEWKVVLDQSQPLPELLLMVRWSAEKDNAEWEIM